MKKKNSCPKFKGGNLYDYLQDFDMYAAEQQWQDEDRLTELQSVLVESKLGGFILQLKSLGICDYKNYK